MARADVQYWKDRLTTWLLSHVAGQERRLKSGMQSVLLQLELKGSLPKPMTAVELFGMHGLWHTMDYVRLVEHLDFFEIDKQYLDLARRNLGRYPVTFHHGDSIAWLRSCEKQYNFVVADIPFSGPFYHADGMPLFLDDLVRITSPGGVLVFNAHAKHLSQYPAFEACIREHASGRTIADLFLVPRNSQVTYVVLTLA